MTINFTGVETKGDVSTQSVVIDTDLSDKEYYFVNFDGTDQGVVNIASAATSQPFILLEGADGSSTETVGTIVTGGKTKLKTGGNITQGAFLTSDANGAAVATTTDDQFYGAIALENGASGDIIAVKAIQGTLSGSADN